MRHLMTRVPSFSVMLKGALMQGLLPLAVSGMQLPLPPGLINNNYANAMAQAQSQNQIQQQGQVDNTVPLALRNNQANNLPQVQLPVAQGNIPQANFGLFGNTTPQAAPQFDVSLLKASRDHESALKMFLNAVDSLVDTLGSDSNADLRAKTLESSVDYEALKNLRSLATPRVKALQHTAQALVTTLQTLQTTMTVDVMVVNEVKHVENTLNSLLQTKNKFDQFNTTTPSSVAATPATVPTSNTATLFNNRNAVKNALSVLVTSLNNESQLTTEVITLLKAAQDKLNYYAQNGITQASSSLVNTASALETVTYAILRNNKAVSFSRATKEAAKTLSKSLKTVKNDMKALNPGTVLLFP